MSNVPHTAMPLGSHGREPARDGQMPVTMKTLGQKPAVLISASITYVGDNQIYAFGGFDHYTDEVYNHVLKLDLNSRQWSLVDNYGDIPGVRMGHTATLWQGNKIIIFGGENEHRAYLSDLIIFDIQTATWRQPHLHGRGPCGRARHSAVLHDDKLYILGGMSGPENNLILDDFCYLDLKTWTWSKTWRFVSRYDHTSWVWGEKLFVFGGITDGMVHVSDLWWMDLKENPNFSSTRVMESPSRRATNQQSYSRRGTSGLQNQVGQTGASAHAANSGSVQIAQGHHSSSRRLHSPPGAISSMTFMSGPIIPTQAIGKNFHAYSSGCLLDFQTPTIPGNPETGLCVFDLESMRWDRLAAKGELFDPQFRWHYCAMNPEGTHVWMLGCPADPSNLAQPNTANEYLSEVLCIDLTRFGLVGNSLSNDMRSDYTRLPASDVGSASPFAGIGADLIRLFNQHPDTGSKTDFKILSLPDPLSENERKGIDIATALELESIQAEPIYVHRLILEARWPHFARAMASGMMEAQKNQLEIPEPYSVVKAFLRYLYTDSIASDADSGVTLNEVAGMLVMAECYEMPRLRLLCRNRLARELDVAYAATIWDKAALANEEWLKRKAAKFCMTHWGYVVRTEAYRNLERASLLELSQEVALGSCIINSDDFETFKKARRHHRARGTTTTTTLPLGIATDDSEEAEGMELV